MHVEDIKTLNFIDKAKIIHDNKYDYSLVSYINNRTKVKIGCYVHGVFEQRPNSHLLGKGCASCSNNIRYSANIFIEKANKVHNNKYDYSLVQYINTRTKVKIICTKHGAFEQIPSHHLNKHGCAECSHDKKKIDISFFIEKSNHVHRNKYDYSLSIYKNNYTKIILICHLHGQFRQAPNSHMLGQGCPLCSPNGKKGISKFIQQANAMHNNKYDYSKFVYINSFTKGIIICPAHGQFQQRAGSHVGGQGCPKCGCNSISIEETQWLDFLDVPIEYRQKTIKINNKNYRVDAYDPITNTIYEFYGDFWHGNPNKFNPNDINPLNNFSFSDLYKNTMQREYIIKNAGYNIVTIWEKEFDKLNINN